MYVVLLQILISEFVRVLTSSLFPGLIWKRMLQFHVYPRTNRLLLAGMSVLIEAAYPLSPNCFIPTKIHDYTCFRKPLSLSI